MLTAFFFFFTAACLVLRLNEQPELTGLKNLSLTRGERNKCEWREEAAAAAAVSHQKEGKGKEGLQRRGNGLVFRCVFFKEEKKKRRKRERMLLQLLHLNLPPGSCNNTAAAAAAANTAADRRWLVMLEKEMMVKPGCCCCRNGLWVGNTCIRNRDMQ